MKSKEEKREYDKKYRAEHKEEIKEYNKQYHAKHIEEEKKYSKQYQLEHKEEIKEKKKQYHAKRMEEDKEYFKQYRAKNKKRMIQYRNNHKEEEKIYNLKRKYNITPEQYNELYDKQNGCCAICKKSQSEMKKVLGVDHNHKTGKVRGLLCDKCNRGLGCLNDNIILLQKGINYLNEND